jgi:hypothetical protein
VDGLCSAVHHFFAGIFNIPARTAITGRVDDQFNRLVSENAEHTFPVSHPSEAFYASAAPVAIADDNAQLGCFLIHDSFSLYLCTFIMLYRELV